MARRRRWILRVLLGLLLLLLLAVGFVLVVLANLDAGPVKSYIRGKALAQGIDLDYDSAGATLGGLHLRGVRVASPPADAPLAPSLATIGTIDGRWSPFSKRIDELVIRDVALTVVVDEDGTTSIDRLVAGMPKSPPPPPTPLSQLLQDALPGGVTAHARVEGITVTVIPRGKGERMKLEGLTAGVDLEHGKLQLRVGPTELRLAVGVRSAVASLGGNVSVEPNRLAATLALALVRQDLAPELPKIERVADLAAVVDFLPGEKRTRVTLQKLALLDGAVTAEAAAELPDEGPPIVRTASCRVDLAALARAVPAAFGPVVVEAEPLQCTARDLELGAAPRGQLALTGKIARVAYRDIEARGIGLDVAATPEGVKAHIPIEKATLPGLAAGGLDVTLRADSKGGAFPIGFHADIAAADVKTPTARVRGARVTADGSARSAVSLDAKIALDVDRVDGPAGVQGVHLDIDARDVTLGGDLPTANLTLGGRIASAAQPKGPRADGITLAVEGRLPTAAKLRVGVQRLAVAQLPPGPAELEVDASKIVLEPPGGEAKISASFAGGTVAGSVAGSAADLRWDLEAHADKVGPARALALRTHGSVGAKIEQDTTVEVGRVATASASLRAARVHLTSSGTLRRLQAQIDAELDGVTVDGKAAGSPRLGLTAVADLDKHEVDVRLKGQAPDTDLHLAAALDATRTLRWEAEGKVAGLAALGALLPEGPDWRRVAVEVHGRGTVSGIVRSVQGGVPVLVADPAASARGRQSLRLDVRQLHYAGADGTSADLAALTVKTDADLGDPSRVTLSVNAPEIGAVASGVHVGVEGLALTADATQPRRGAGNVKLVLRAKRIRQSAFASYPVRDLDLTVNVTGDPKDALAIHVKLVNPGAGTTFEANGALDQRAAPAADAVPGRHSVAVNGTLAQELDKLDGAPETLRARGRVQIPFRVESGDLALFRATARIKLDGVDVELPAQKLRVSDVRGELPVLQEIVLGPEGAQLVGRGELGLYPEHRYGDQQPFLGAVDYLSVGELRVGDTRVGPLAANVRVNRDVVALDQLEMVALDGKIAGQTLIELRQKDTRVAFRGKVTGIRPTSGTDRLDANAAVTLTPYRLGLEGRIDIVRISSAHLLDVLDLVDPYRADVAMNKMRLALKLGYPKQVRLHFLHGFASMHIELGGLVGKVQLEDIRGVPIGPALESWLAPVLEQSK